MSYFRLPVNLVTVVLLVVTNWMSTSQICVAAFSVMGLGVLANLVLLIKYKSLNISDEDEI